MRNISPLLVAVLLIGVSSADAGGRHGSRYGAYSCPASGVSRASYRRLQQDYQDVVRLSRRQLRECYQDSATSQRNYQNILNYQNGTTAELIRNQDKTAAALSALAADKGLPPDLFERPTKAEFEALRERYDTLIAAYRNLERNYQAMGGKID